LINYIEKDEKVKFSIVNSQKNEKNTKEYLDISDNIDSNIEKLKFFPGK
jgi:hypothetical protein